MPSIFASIGRDPAFARGPEIGVRVAVVEHPERYVIRRTATMQGSVFTVPLYPPATAHAIPNEATFKL
jgi:hypothetical protein